MQQRVWAFVYIHGVAETRELGDEDAGGQGPPRCIFGERDVSASVLIDVGVGCWLVLTY